MTENPLPTLPMHLMLTMGSWLSSPFAYACASSASPLWSSGNSPKLPDPKVQSALAEEARNRAHKFLYGIERYLEAGELRRPAEPPAIWKKGNARLLDYGNNPPPNAPLVLFIPSLINRYYILDLEEERSMLRTLARQGIWPLALDWDTPGKLETDFGCDDYVTEILNPAVEFISKAAGRPIALAGYCMGGNLALASAQLLPKHVSALALLATPWNFHCDAFRPFVIEPSWLPMIDELLKSQKQLPADAVQSLFYMTDPWVFEQKFRRFASLAKDSRAAHDFLALERWVNDGVPLTSQVARDCLIGWAQKNQMMKSEWRVAGQTIDPAQWTKPAFIAIPQNDHVVPLDCAAPLAEAMPKAKVLHPGAGHVGMIVGSSANKDLWQPLAGWLRESS